MTLVRRSVTGAVAGAAVALLVSGCGGDGSAQTSGDGARFSAAVDDAGFRGCAEPKGLDASGAKDWSAARRQRFASDARALDCAVEKLGPGADLDALMQVGFADAGQTDAVSALSHYVDKMPGAATERSRRVGLLLGALDPKRFDPGWDTFAIRQQLAWDVVRSVDPRQPAYDEWLKKHPNGRDSGATPDVPFLQDLEDARTGTPEAALQEKVAQMSKLIDQAQEGDLD